jgi:hypothetical protein
MRNPRDFSFGEKVKRHLLREGFGRKYANRATLELNDHWLELIHEGMRCGLSEAESVRNAQRDLGDPASIAREISIRMQRSTWFGRAPTFSFASLALILTLLWWIALGSAAAACSGLFTAGSGIHGDAPNVGFFALCVDWIRSTSYLALPCLCCFIAERLYCGWRPALWACLILSIHNAAQFVRVTGSGIHGNISVGYSFSFDNMPNLLAMLAPLAVFFIYQLWRTRGHRSSHDLIFDIC